ncbi:type II and III secretion system protein family protein [Spongorhabdus nitratireducens]
MKKAINIRWAALGWLVLTLCSSLAHAAGILHLETDEARSLNYDRAIGTVFIANPKIANYQVVNNKQVIVFGKGIGSTSLLLLDSDGNTIDRKTLSVRKNLGFIRQQIIARYPGSKVELANLGDEVVLSGLVSTEQERQGIYNMVGELLKKKYIEEKLKWESGDNSYDIRFLTNRQYKGVVNNIELDAAKQVNVKLTIAEVSQSFIRQLGVQWGTVNPTGTAFLQGNGGFFNVLGNGLNSSNIARYISAVDDDAMGQILAQPNLSVISGETASFLAGGELPIITYRDDAVNVTYKDFGVRLDLAAEVLRNEKINLSLMPEVSSIDPSIKNNLNLPGFKTRRTRTTVQLGDGESFILGGLLNSEDREALSKIPFIGDVPVLGAMFRNTRDERQQTELVIVATVNLVKPVQPESIRVPRLEMSQSLVQFLNLKDPKFFEDVTHPVKQQALSLLSSGGFKE